jgi:hypothetical protein
MVSIARRRLRVKKDSRTRRGGSVAFAIRDRRQGNAGGGSQYYRHASAPNLAIALIEDQVDGRESLRGPATRPTDGQSPRKPEPCSLRLRI